MATKKKFAHILDQVSASLSLLGERGVLPALRDIELRRDGTGDAWTVKAYVGGINGFETATEAIRAVKAYAEHGEGALIIHDAYPSIAQRSGTQVSLKARVEVDGIAVEVCALLDGDEYAAAIAAETQTAVSA